MQQEILVISTRALQICFDQRLPNSAGLNSNLEPGSSITTQAE